MVAVALVLLAVAAPAMASQEQVSEHSGVGLTQHAGA
jgi:hypothetical protein